MTLEEAAASIGRAVVYHPAPSTAEAGVITAATSRFVFVRFGADQHSKATAAGQLELAGGDACPA